MGLLPDGKSLFFPWYEIVLFRSVQLRSYIQNGDIYKMSLGKSGMYENEAFERASLIFQSEIDLYEAVVSQEPKKIEFAASKVWSEKYPSGGAPREAWSVWVRNIENFVNLPEGALVIHWEARRDRLFWGVVDDKPFEKLRSELSETGQMGYVFSRRLKGQWFTETINGIPLSNIHPKARDLAINRATINQVQSDPGFFRALILDEDITQWTLRTEWQAAAKKHEWHPKPVVELLEHRRRTLVTPVVQSIADEFEADVKRMAATAMQTVGYANGQRVLQTVKVKDTDMTREQLELEIGLLLKEQKYRCGLTDYQFKSDEMNKHLLPSLDRIDSSKGYVRGNLQIVTRAANFFKSASDEADWRAKAEAMHKMALAMQRHRRGSVGAEND